MSPVMGPIVEWPFQFDEAVNRLQGDYPEIWRAIQDFQGVLTLGYDLPEVPVDAVNHPNVYTIHCDYPPLGPLGTGIFQVLYHATDPLEEMAPNIPYRVFTLIDIWEA
ncbi:MAG: hypothetical protein ACKVVP_23885 [Chloroflexota bacterium]